MLDVPVVVRVLVAEVVTELVAELVIDVLALDVCVEVAVVRSHVRPDPSSKLSIAKFKAATSVSQADSASTAPSKAHVSSPAALLKKSST